MKQLFLISLFAIFVDFQLFGDSNGIGTLNADWNCVTNTGRLSSTDKVKADNFEGYIDYRQFSVEESGTVEITATATGGYAIGKWNNLDLFYNFYYDGVVTADGGPYLRNAGRISMSVVPKTVYSVRMYTFIMNNDGMLWQLVIKYTPGGKEKEKDGNVTDHVTITNVVTKTNFITKTNIVNLTRYVTVTNYVTATGSISETGYDVQVPKDVREFYPSIGFTGRDKAIFDGIVYNKKNIFCGLAQISTAKAKSNASKISGFVILNDGKKQALKSTAGLIEGGLLSASVKVGKIGTAELTVGENGFRGALGDMTIVSADVDEDTGILKGALSLSYFAEKTHKLKTKKITVNGVSSNGEAIGEVLMTKGQGSKEFSAVVE